MRQSLNMSVAILILFFIAAVPGKSTAENLKNIIIEGLAIIGPHTTKSEARVMALNNARRNAIEEASGLSVSSTTIVSSHTVLFDLIRASSRGIIVEEEILDENKRFIKDKTPGGKIITHETYTIKLRAVVKPIEPNKDFKITKLSLYKAGRDESLMMPVFTSNEEVQIGVRVNKDSYINIFCINQDGAVTQLLPSRYFQHVLLKAGMELIFPEDAQRGLGLCLRAKVPDGVQKAIESIVVIATKQDDELLQNVKGPTLIDLWRELSEMNPSVWAEDMVGYEVRR